MSYADLTPEQKEEAKSCKSCDTHMFYPARGSAWSPTLKLMTFCGTTGAPGGKTQSRCLHERQPGA